MKQYLLLLITLISTLSFAQRSGDVVFYSNSGEKFYVVMNGVRQNMAPETNVKVQGLTNDWYGCKIISSTNSFELEKNVPVKMDTLITYQIVGKKGKYKLRFFSETPLKSAPTTGGQTIVNYSPVENTGTTTTNVGTTGTTTNVGTTGTTTNVGTTGTTTTTNVGTTGTTTNVGTTGVGTTTTVGTTGTTGTTTTTTTTGTTTSGTGNPEGINININVSENGAGINISETGTGTGTGTTNTSTTTTNNGTSTVQTTTSTTTGGNGTSTYYEETTTTTTNTGNIYQDPDMTVTLETSGTGVGTTTTSGTTTGTATNTGTVNNGNCYTSDTDFATIKKSVSAESFEDDQLGIAKMATKSKCLTVKQIGEIMTVFKFSEGQLEFAKYAYTNCANKNDYYQLMEIFKFSDEKEALEAFINAQ